MSSNRNTLVMADLSVGAQLPPAEATESPPPPQPRLTPEEAEEARKVSVVRIISLLDGALALYLLAFYGNKYFYSPFFWSERCDENQVHCSISFWDFELTEGATWFGIFVVHSFQLLSALYLCPSTNPTREDVQERCNSWLYSSKILIKILIFECFILFIPHRKPVIFQWWIFIIKAAFRGGSTTAIAHYLIGWLEQERNQSGLGGNAAAGTVRTHSTTIIPILTSHHRPSCSRSRNGRSSSANSTIASLYAAAGLGPPQHELGDTAIAIEEEEEPPPPYSEAIKYCKEQPLYLHV